MSSTENVAGNYYDKYNATNPVARWLMRGFLSAFDELVRKSGATSAFEVGCGEAHLVARLLDMGLEVSGCDIDEAVVGEAKASALGRPNLKELRVASLYELTERDAAPLIVCCEVLEHVPDPDTALDILAGLARPHLLVSVPREPLWRFLNLCRGKYVADWGNTPGHNQHWSQGAFLRFLSRRFELLHVRLPLPWTMALCKVR